MTKKKELSAKTIAILVLIGIFWLYLKYDQIRIAQESKFEFLFSLIICVALFVILTTSIMHIFKPINKPLIMIIFTLTGALCGITWFFVVPNETISMLTPIIIGIISGIYFGFTEILIYSSHNQSLKHGMREKSRVP